jgi:hypothetical protein
VNAAAGYQQTAIDPVNHWIPRAALITLASALVATTLPAVKEQRAVDSCAEGGGVYDYAARACRTDVESRPSRPIALFRAPDGGSLMVAAFVALAILRLFVTLDRRSRARRAAS